MASLSLRDGLLIAGRYRIAQPLGHGAHGAVYEAVRVHDGVRVALKMMHERHLDTTDAGRFAREWALVQRLTGPHVVRILDFGHEDLLPFIVFERLQGCTLAEEIERVGALGVERTARISRQVLAALEEAHAHNIVHRDIKPANIFLCRSEEAPGDRVKVLDFGTAKTVGEDAGSALTATGQMLGTAQYMSPEQVRGASEATAAADLYSLGTVMAEMLTGDKLVTGANQIEVFMRHVAPEPLDIPDAVRDSPLGPVIARALEKQVADRWPSAAAMGAAIDQILGQLPATASPVSLPQHWEEPPPTRPMAIIQEPATPEAAILRPVVTARPRRRRWPWVAAALVFVAMGALAAWSLHAPPSAWPFGHRPVSLELLSAQELRLALEREGIAVRPLVEAGPAEAIEHTGFELLGEGGEAVGSARLDRYQDSGDASRAALPEPAPDRAVRRAGAVTLVIAHPGADELMARIVE